MTDESSQTVRSVVLSASALGLVWMGDGLLGIVLPLHAASFGIALPWVGVVLSLSRIVCIFGYGWIGGLTGRFGGKALMVGAALTAAVSTFLYGLAQGLMLLLAGRCLWGLAYGALNVLTTVYAFSDGKTAGRLVGLSRAISTLGNAIALSGGALATAYLGPRDVFLVLGVIGLFAVPVSLALPALRDISAEQATRSRSRWKPSLFNMLFFTLMVAVDGSLPMTLSLLFAQRFSVGSALLTAGLILAALRATIVIGSLIGGRIVESIGANRVLGISVVSITIGLLGVAAGFIYTGTGTIIIGRAFLGTVGRVLVAKQTGGTNVERASAYWSWIDCGLAAGPLVVGALFVPLGPTGLYSLLALAVTIAFAAYAAGIVRARTAVVAPTEAL
ncbi:MFS transporter [Bradyrhizobium sp. SZCCHNRI20481]|uniref:MFS transporter n=1 Tax=Bradyrhizobium sp. SZCCHNRI20481 TaxID=3057286 RepID=UPI002916A26F|nr:MFS transporter [Bradyrhizobium sp. SZCCHNRI20481]